MFRRVKAVLAALAVLGLPAAQAASPVPDLHASAAVIGAQTSVPYGWMDFCNRYGGECDGPGLPAVDTVLTARTFKEIERINRSVNASVAPVTDTDHWGVVDRWDYPLDGRGDCEDYALLKRRRLMEAGYPRQSLLMTVVKDGSGEGHAVLTVKTNRGDYVLDNMTDEVMAWDRTGYRFVKRQSQEDPNLWRSMTPGTSAPLFTSNR